ncbi:MAG: hypothetical protein RIS09_851 [Actinomycetota bacterium]
MLRMMFYFYDESVNDVVWNQFQVSLNDLVEQTRVRPEISLELAPAPAKLATHTAALLADVDTSYPVGNGRLVILYEPEYQIAWEGHIRFVSYINAQLEPELITDSLLLEVGWSWIKDALSNVEYLALSGTISRNDSQSFGDISARLPEGSIEMRASWTISQADEFPAHLSAWLEMLQSACGLEPLPEGVTHISSNRNK